MHNRVKVIGLGKLKVDLKHIWLKVKAGRSLNSKQIGSLLDRKLKFKANFEKITVSMLNIAEFLKTQKYFQIQTEQS